MQTFFLRGKDTAFRSSSWLCRPSATSTWGTPWDWRGASKIGKNNIWIAYNGFMQANLRNVVSSFAALRRLADSAVPYWYGTTSPVELSFELRVSLSRTLTPGAGMIKIQFSLLRLPTFQIRPRATEILFFGLQRPWPLRNLYQSRDLAEGAYPLRRWYRRNN